MTDWTAEKARQYVQRFEGYDPNMPDVANMRNLLSERDALIRLIGMLEQGYKFTKSAAIYGPIHKAWQALPEYLRKEIEDG